MVLLENAVCLFVIFIVVRYSFLCYAIYWLFSQSMKIRDGIICYCLVYVFLIIYCYLTHYLPVYGCNGYSGNFSLLFRCRILRSYYCG